MARLRNPIVDKDLISTKRIPFGPEIATKMPCSWVNGRGWTHRRHIISQHFFRGAWNAMAPEICGAGMVWLGKVAEHVVMVPARLPSTSKAMDQTLRMRVVASEILRWMNDNPNNLFVDDGGENSGIGSFTHDMEAILGSLENLNWSQNSFNDIKGDVLEEIGKRSGSWGRVAKEHYASIKPTAIALVKDAECPEDLVSVVEDLAFSTDFDLDKADASKDKNMLLWKVREGFLAFAKEENKNLLEFGELIVEFVENGWS